MKAMPASAWDSLLARLRNRRGRHCGGPPDFAPEPAPALELVIRLASRRSGFPAFIGGYDSLNYLLKSAVDSAYWAESLALESGTLRDRQIADDALTSCIRVAARIVARRDAPPSEGERPHGFSESAC